LEDLDPDAHMTDFIDPNDFDSEEQLFDYILENLIKPKLREALGDDGDIEQVSGLVYVFGGRGGVEPEVIERIQTLVSRGMDLDYVLREMTDLAVSETKESRYGDLLVRYVELEREPDETEPLSVEDLETMFGGSTDDSDEHDHADDADDRDDRDQRGESDDELN
jgi:hypothetical protein